MAVKNRTVLVGALLVVAVVAIAFAGRAYADRAGAIRVTRDFWDAAARGDADALGELLISDAESPPQVWIERLRSMQADPPEGPVTLFDPPENTCDLGYGATVALESEKNGSILNTIYLKKVDGKWRVVGSACP